ncbi:hypothetical protein GCM10011415_26480 [Salipiger pallidus]|uniref:Uncharacterized protein n=2 Tax=Salipiger pallidus TaxID=1775170 RepID=A0A8J2ZL64_9RHOB|nr:hypothetical protein GCM10011415_26480 [Salipiger pallidus]
MAFLAHRGLWDLADWPDAAGAFTQDVLDRQPEPFPTSTCMFRKMLGVARVAKVLRSRGDAMKPTGNLFSAQAPLSLRVMLQIQGAVRDKLAQIAGVISRDLRDVSESPGVAGHPDAPEDFIRGTAIGAAVALACGRLSVLAGQFGGISERCIDCLSNPLAGSLPASLAPYGGNCSSVMIALCTAVARVNENRILAVLARLGGGIAPALPDDALRAFAPAVGPEQVPDWIRSRVPPLGSAPFRGARTA